MPLDIGFMGCHGNKRANIACSDEYNVRAVFSDLQRCSTMELLGSAILVRDLCIGVTYC